MYGLVGLDRNLLVCNTEGKEKRRVRLISEKAREILNAD